MEKIFTKAEDMVDGYTGSMAGFIKLVVLKLVVENKWTLCVMDNQKKGENT